MKVIYFVDDKLGGVTSLCYNLVANAPMTDYEQWVVQVDWKESDMTRANLVYPATKNIHFIYSSRESQYAEIKRLFELLPTEEGALVVNYQFEMEMLDHHHVRQTVYQLVHDDYNLGLAKKFHHVVDVFIAHNKHIYEQLLKALPSKSSNIYYQPHGVPLPTYYRVHSEGEDTTLRLLFLGRMNKLKGIFDLPVISRLLKEKNIKVEWTCIGNGPEKEQLMQQWKEENVRFTSPATNEEVLKLASEQDVFVLPTKFEGSPVSLLETMSVGLVPVITDLEGGIQEIVTEEIGFRVQMDNNHGFAEAITRLHSDRKLMKSMSVNARKKIESKYAVTLTAGGYHDLFKEYKKNFHRKTIQKNKIGARLDQSWLPSVVTRTIRNIFMQGKPNY
jgi:glycosyltransferase involved in cell wall biosynthesis